MDKQIAMAIINSLSGGTVPERYVNFYDVGRQNQLDLVKKEIGDGRDRLRFVNGDYGTGKTHFLATIRHWALQNDFVPSHVVLSPRGTPLYSLEAVYSRTIKNLVLDNNDNLSPIESVLEFLYQAFQEWIERYKYNDHRCEKTLIEPLFCDHCNKVGNVESMYIENFRSLDVQLQIAIMIYRTARWGHNPDFKTAEMVIRWIEGERLYRSKLNYLGLWSSVSQDDILRGLSEIALLVSLVGKKGLIVMLDEAEGIEKLSPYQKQSAYDNLKFLINGAKQIDNLYFLYATTPTFFNDVSSNSGDLDSMVNRTACTNLMPLSESEKKTLAQKILEIYNIASKESCTNEDFAVFTEKAKGYCNADNVKRLVSVRDFITGLLNEFKN